MQQQVFSKGTLRFKDNKWYVEYLEFFRTVKDDNGIPYDVEHLIKGLPIDPNIYIDPILNDHPVEYVEIRMYKNANFNWSESIPPSELANCVYSGKFAKIFYPRVKDCVCNCDKSSCPGSSCITHAEHQKITGHNTITESEKYDKGRDDEQEVVMEWIKNWDGSTNSALGTLLMKKLKEVAANKIFGPHI